MKKPRSDSKLLNLPDEQMAALSDWLLGGMDYTRARLLLKKEYKIESSEAALSRFYSEVCVAAHLSRRQRAISTSEEIAGEAQKHPGRFDQATIDAIKQKAFELSISPQSSSKDVKALFMLVLKSRDQDLEARRVAVMEQKLKETEKVVGDAKLTAAEKELRIKNVFGIQ